MGNSQLRRTAADVEPPKTTAREKNASKKTPASGRFQSLRTWWEIIDPWFGLAVRLALAAVLLVAGFGKVTELQSSVLAVRAFQLLPVGMTEFVGYALPIGEILLGLVLLAGLFTRYAAIANGLLMSAFIFGIIWAWSKGLSIDCGCFGGGGEIERTSDLAKSYLLDIMRDALLVAGSIYLVIRPRTKFSLDSMLEFKEL